MANVDYDGKIKLYDKFYKGTLILTSLVAVTLLGIGVRQNFIVTGRIDDNLLRTQSIIDNNQKGALEARKNNVDRQIELKNYFKCLVLLRYDAPTLTVNSSRAATEAALDNCAKVE